ncbi:MULTISPECIES: hypothetical protein [unclassified Curtobacterium]|uniref:hypothetical protein n=1 Tax=unclassified Curtobacterium TaxID=257496 RepID=UPI000D8E358E|nr:MULTISPECIES: hypothetical protein [unclassified Curtobacterium]PYY33206.1 hypothetical protein DEI89_11065 [Curtobacterium sp. MCBD17_030]PZE38570.1 hypothetical protein DEJ31_04640 [Curtobacterium sp. MCPF17_031]PZF10982.1 hypothetical protein DEJ25_11355 [Curtobacterium sp. MCPF17_011]
MTTLGEYMYRARHERPTRPTATVRRSPWGAAALTSAAAGITALGVRILSATAFYGDADLVRIGTGSFTVVLGIGLVLLGVRSLRSRVRVFPDRLEARSGFAPTHVVRPGEIVRIEPRLSGHVGVSGVTDGQGSFLAGRFDRHYDVLADWLSMNATRPWAEYQDLLGKLTHQTRPRVVRGTLTGLLLFVVMVPALELFPALLSLSAYDDAHPQDRTCSVTSAEGSTISSRSTRGIGSSHPAVTFTTRDCGPLVMRDGVDSDSRDVIARRYDRAPGEYTFTLGGGSLWLQEHLPWFPVQPGVDAVRPAR